MIGVDRDNEGGVRELQDLQDEQGHVNEKMEIIEKSLQKQEMEESNPIINLVAEGHQILDKKEDLIEDNYQDE